MTGRADRAGAALAFGFLILLLGTEGALSLPDADATAASAATFYADHRAVIVVLQVVGFLAAGLLAAYAWRLRGAHPWVSRTGLLTAVLALAPGLLVIAAALAADPAAPAPAGRWNAREPIGDDLLFVGILLFCVAIAATLHGHAVTRAIAAVVAVQFVVRLVVEALGDRNAVLDQIAPVGFLVVVAALGVLSLRGRLRPLGSPSGAGGSASAAA